MGAKDPSKKKPSVPTKPATVGPNIRANPPAQNSADDKQKSTRFLTATLILFLERTNPVSKQQKPACISSTSAVQLITQVMSWSVVSGMVVNRFAAPGPRGHYGVVKRLMILIGKALLEPAASVRR